MPDNSKPKKTGRILIILSIFLILVNCLLTPVLMDIPSQEPLTNEAQGHIVGAVLANVMIPFLVVALFQIGKRFRNTNSRVKVFFWTSFVILLSKFGTMLSSINHS